MKKEWKENGKFIHACGLAHTLLEAFGRQADYVELVLGDRTIRIYREEIEKRWRGDISDVWRREGYTVEDIPDLYL